jgi:hypothetical protein
MAIITSIFIWFVSIADAIVYGVLYFFAIIILIIAFATADGDDYWAEGGMPLSTESSVD